MTYEERKVIREVIEKLQNLINTEEDNIQDIMIVVTNYIRKIGIPAHLKGYVYLREAIMLVLDDPTRIDSITKNLYPVIAKKFGTSNEKVERAMRSAIEIAWERGNIQIINEIFGYIVDIGRGKPTNSEFIALIADEIRLKHKVILTRHYQL